MERLVRVKRRKTCYIVSNLEAEKSNVNKVIE
jgi:hypothetical protein